MTSNEHLPHSRSALYVRVYHHLPQQLPHHETRVRGRKRWRSIYRDVSAERTRSRGEPDRRDDPVPRSTCLRAKAD